MARFLLLFVISVSCAGQDYPWVSLTAGKYKVGFMVTGQRDVHGDSSRICIWYPSYDSPRNPMTIKEFILKGKVNNKDYDTTDLVQLKQLVERIYDSSLDESYYSFLKTKTNTSYKAAMAADRKFPLVIAWANSSYYFDTFEFLASHGFIVATIGKSFKEDPPSPDGPNHYKRDTDLLADLLKFVLSYPSADTSHINAFGHGRGIQPAVYLSMRTNKIKNIVNEDGGFFSPRSKSTNSSDYHPEKLRANLLHITTPSLNTEDDQAQFKASSNPIYKVSIKPEIRHHDFTLFGHVYHSMIKNENDTEVRKVISGVDQTILEFLNGNLKTIDSKLFSIQRYN